MTRTKRAWDVRRSGRGASVFLLLLITAACGRDAAEIPVPQAEADRILFERGSDAMNEENWAVAREYFIQIRDNYPQSPYRADARLLIGDTYEAEGSAESSVRALNEFQDFLSLYPTHPRAAYARYKVGMVHFQQMKQPERDQSETVSAIREFEGFLAQYPEDHELTPIVREQLRAARDRLSRHHFLVGAFYHRFESWAGAISRFREILESDPEYSGRDEVYYYLGDALGIVGETAEAIPYLARVVEEFEDSQYADAARRRLAELEAAEGQ